jgi:hypothetical protein
VDDFESPFGPPGEPVPTVDAKDMKAVWELGPDSEARALAHDPHFKRGQVAIGVEAVKLVCSSGADVIAVSWRGARLAMLMMRFGKQDRQTAARHPVHHLREGPDEVVGSRSPAARFVLGVRSGNHDQSN